MNKIISRLIRNLILLVGILVCCTLSIHTIAASTSKKYAFTLKPNLRGEWNITISGGSNVSKPTLYKKNIFGKEKKVNDAKITKNDNGYVIKCSLEKKGNYVVRLTANKSPKCSYGRNYDKYSSKKNKLSKGIQWLPNEDSYQPYELNGIRTVQVAYLTKEETMVYALKLDRKKYLKLIDTGVSLTSFLAFAGISETSALGRAITSVGKNKIASVAKKIVTGLGGISLIPSLSKFVLNSIKENSNNYTTGIRVIVSWTDRGCYTNNYTSWDGYSNSIYGREYCRGKFSKYTKLRGWY